MTEFEFVDELPEDRRGRPGPRPQTVAALEAMANNPGKWLVYTNVKNAHSANIAKALAKYGSYEVKSRKQPDGTTTVYTREVPK